MKNILVPIDFSETTESTIDQAASLAKTYDAKLWLLHVCEPDPDFISMKAGPQSARDQLAAKFTEEHHVLDVKAAELRERGIDAVDYMLQGPTVETILRKAESMNVDLIVIGRHRHGALHRLLLGSVSEGVLRQAKVPVLMLPPHSPS